MGCDLSTFGYAESPPSESEGVNFPTPVEIVQHKIILVGDISVGKSSLVQRLLGKEFREEHISTIGTAFASVSIQPKEDMEAITIQVWDTAGEERYRSMSRFFFRGTQVGILVFDVQVHDSLRKLKSWQEDIEGVSPTASFVVVANKIDCGDEMLRTVSREEGEQFAQEIHAQYVETSAKTGEGVLAMFRIAALLSMKSNSAYSNAVVVSS